MVTQHRGRGAKEPQNLRRKVSVPAYAQNPIIAIPTLTPPRSNTPSNLAQPRAVPRLFPMLCGSRMHEKRTHVGIRWFFFDIDHVVFDCGCRAAPAMLCSHWSIGHLL